MRRYTAMKPSRGTVIPASVRAEVKARDGNNCVGQLVGMEHVCFGAYELDHVRASGGISLKSRSTADNLVQLCSVAHRIRTEYGKTWRQPLLDYIASKTA